MLYYLELWVYVEPENLTSFSDRLAECQRKVGLLRAFLTAELGALFLKAAGAKAVPSLELELNF